MPRSEASDVCKFSNKSEVIFGQSTHLKTSHTHKLLHFVVGDYGKINRTFQNTNRRILQYKLLV